MSYKLPNYLRAHRKRTRLTQDEVAFLLGNRRGSKLSRYERFHHQPSLRKAFALEVVYRAPVQSLFAGVHKDVARRTRSRARRLIARLAKNGSIEKVAALRSMATPLPSNHKPRT